MKIVNPQSDTPIKHEPYVDWSRPIVQFTPWPFLDEMIELTPEILWFNSLGAWVEGHGSIRLEEDEFLGYTTDGRRFATSEAGYKILQERRDSNGR